MQAAKFGQENLTVRELGMEDGVVRTSEHLLPTGEWGNKQQQDRKSVAGRLGVGGPPLFLGITKAQAAKLRVGVAFRPRNLKL